MVLVQELDPAKGACVFRRFFDVTPKDLLKAKLYHTLAVPLYPNEEHREVSTRYIARAMGGRPAKKRKKISIRAAAAIAPPAAASASQPASASQLAGSSSRPASGKSPARGMLSASGKLEPLNPQIEGFDNAVALAAEGGEASDDAVKDLSDRVVAGVKGLFSPSGPPPPARTVQGDLSLLQV